MTDRDRLIELVEKAKEEYVNNITDHTETDYIVECLLNNGVIVPPYKVGDVVYDGMYINNEDMGETVFLTKEEAEAKLKECDT